eukprot:gb/GECG01002774.1/.p1 GENE.gb/GECG01002774.1/~~gb/GECG01002774.1/.p1  ORF type:complete len:143 (+),score=7.75 gb/GECG01002774.1/:1-429(+)
MNVALPSERHRLRSQNNNTLSSGHVSRGTSVHDTYPPRHKKCENNHATVHRATGGQRPGSRPSPQSCEHRDTNEKRKALFSTLCLVLMMHTLWSSANRACMHATCYCLMTKKQWSTLQPNFPHAIAEWVQDTKYEYGQYVFS